MTGLAAVALAMTGSGSPAEARTRACDDSLKASFRPDRNTRVTAVMAFRKGDDLAPSFAEGKALEDLCMVRLLVGPGNPGPADAPSTSPGIGIEVWLPSAEKWNGRFHALGGGGMSGRLGDGTLIAEIAGKEGAVSAFTDVGHRSFIGTRFDMIRSAVDSSYLLNPDGKLSAFHWAASGNRGIHELAVKTKALIRHYYGRPVRYSYFQAGSNGGRQGHVAAQNHPKDFDGIYSGAPAINFNELLTSALYPQVLMKQELGRPLRPEQLYLASSAAISACDSTVSGEHDGYLSDPAACRYDPARDLRIVCKSDGGTNETPACVTRREAAIINRIWYGMTADGSAPDPATSIGKGDRLDPGQIWYGVPRGVALAGGGTVANSVNGDFDPLVHSSRWMPVLFENAALGTPDFTNATGNGKDGWKQMGYADLVKALAAGRRIESANGAYFGDKDDLRAFAARGGKLLVDHGLSDQIIAPEGTHHYFRRLVDRFGSVEKVHDFYRYFPVPGLDHGRLHPLVAGLIGVSPAPEPPELGRDRMYEILVDWVEKGIAPERIDVSNKSGTIQRPLCLYPAKVVHTGGNKARADSYTCR